MMGRYHRHSLARAHRRCCVRFGHTHVLCSLSPQRYGYFPATCHVGPHWGCLLVTYFLALGPFVFLLLFVNELRLGLQVALFASMCVTTVSLTLVACSDPGVVFQDVDSDVEDGESAIVCAQCEVRRPFDASHCSDCGVCIRELDHHCPWTGKCIGKRTIKLFYVFLTCISLHCMLVGAACLVTFAAT
uniref:Palmitoyltransferase n=1 Tax=Peronospora matthiolae TaxID=2874970 RepID=A0AAV1U220_9STRA